MIPAVSALALSLALLLPGPAVVPALPTPRVLEEVVAVVGDAPLLASDLELARLVGLPGGDDDLLGALIRLEVEYRDLEASGALYRLKIDPASTETAFAEHAGGRPALEAALQAHGLKWSDVRLLALRVASVNAYVDQRLRPRVHVTAEDLRQEYRDALVPALAARGVAAPPLAEVREQLQRLLEERRLNQEIASWLEQAQERLGVTRFAP